ncbi:UNVERIFIED_CONTAM: PHD finger protein EHD3 [Sesamum indicum]
MVDEQKDNSVLGGGSYTESGVVEPKVDGAKANGRATGMETGLPELGGGLLTYQRRRNAKVVENGILRDGAEIQHVEKIWTKLQKVGADMIAIAKRLSDKTMMSFREQVGSSAHSISEFGRHEVNASLFPPVSLSSFVSSRFFSLRELMWRMRLETFLTQESDMHKAELTEACAIGEVHTCRRCGEKTDGRNGLVCDSCEEMYHISCIEPAVKEIPVRSWYCAKCTGKGTECPHENCIACERLNASRSRLDGNGEDELVSEEAPEDLEESSNELVANGGDKRFTHCKVCRTEVRNDEDYRICGHSFCPHKFYHVKCLTSKQLISHGPCWYCPSCLCRACLIDRDDDKIVLCDGCDHAYHIYCMQPPRTAIPRGKWFCIKCDAGIQRVRKAKFLYENIQNKSRKRSLDGKLKTEEALNKSGGVDMLLNAAKTLNYEENLAAMRLKAT